MLARTPTITQIRLKEVLNYDPITGAFTAKVDRRGSKFRVGDQVGTYSPKDDCLLVSIDGRTYTLHNLAWLWTHGELPPKQLIKFDGNGRNVAISNLALSGSGGDLTQDRLKNFLDYDAKTGVFIWKIRPSKNVPVGSVAGALKSSRIGDVTGVSDKLKHRVIRIEDVEYQASRLAWFYVYGHFPDRMLRFLDGDSDNLAIRNLAMPEHDARDHDGKLEYQRSWKNTEYGAYREKDLLRDFGITLNVYEQLSKAQGGVCAICKRTEIVRRGGVVKKMAVDHCHSSNAVRGLLCQACNTGLGYFEDDAERMEAATAYVRKDHSVIIDGNVVRFIKKGRA